MKTSDYVHEGDALVWRRQLVEADVTLALSAEDIRESPTGIHARLKILGNNAVLAYSTFNIDRDEDRVRLSNSAYSHLTHLKNTYSKEYLKNDLDQFCLGLWDAKLEEFAPEMLSGTLVPTPPSFALEPYIIDGGGTIMFAPPGRGKSFTLLLMEVCVDAGLQTFWKVRQARTLFINLERSRQSIRDRLGNINQVLGVDRDRPLPTINARGRSLIEIAKAAEAHIRKFKTEVVFVDSISRAGAGDLAGNEQANRIIDVLNRIAPSWVGLAHTPRNDQSHLYGSVHFEAGADIVVQLASEQEGEGPLGVGLQITKSNDVGRAPMRVLAFEFGASGLRLARNARPGEFPDVESLRRMTNKEAIRQHMLDIGQPMDATQVAEDLDLNRSVVADILRIDTKMFAKGDKIGHRQRYVVVS